jgi:cyclopropane fatty-acyl-phospholipid synthase-like methyltransferase
MRKPRKKKSRPAGPTLAQQADKHALYENAVQCVEAEIDFVDETFKELRSREASRLREDFCGTANSSCEWIRRRPTNRATGVDLDADVQQWGRDHHLSRLDDEQRTRIELIHGDVLEVETEPVDAVLAMNFSYWVFKQRDLLIRYFRRIHEALVDDGILFLDCFGGYEAFEELKERRKCKGFTYVWHQARYNPITGDYRCKIHFKFKDGSQIKNAFVYDWRLWTLPELSEMLVEAGFRPSVYWEQADEDGEGSGIFKRTNEGDADAGWIAYLVAEKVVS